ncbi:hypothetical protein F0562_026180 [Nyssa sinensis]|uniref:Pentapeptide repeat-containing protein n=1 Tax=Nyssa sinensis TaxID=561372 RepID=A0A5J5BA34_9ASTE|nr:hypothetical protein F0562_026180 [Nyssa sinensis]
MRGRWEHVRLSKSRQKVRMPRPTFSLSVAFSSSIPHSHFSSILRQANFKGAKVLRASFFDASLTGADLRDADSSLANVTQANMSNANLEGALARRNTSFRRSAVIGAALVQLIIDWNHGPNQWSQTIQ